MLRRTEMFAGVVRVKVADYRLQSSATSKWMKRFFGLPLLPCDEVAESFTEDIMFNMPDDTR